MEAKIDLLLIPALLARGVQLHSRRDFRRGCACSYCEAKRAWTRSIAHVKIIGPGPLSPPYALTEYWDDYAYLRHRRVIEARKLEIKKAREDLANRLTD